MLQILIFCLILAILFEVWNLGRKFGEKQSKK